MSFGADSVTGTLKYVDDYTGFSSKLSEQSGHYIAFQCEANQPGTTITAKISKTSTLDSDGIAVFRVSNKDSQTLTVVAKKEGFEDVTRVFSLSGLTLGEQPSQVITPTFEETEEGGF